MVTAAATPNDQQPRPAAPQGLVELNIALHVPASNGHQRKGEDVPTTLTAIGTYRATHGLGSAEMVVLAALTRDLQTLVRDGGADQAHTISAGELARRAYAQRGAGRRIGGAERRAVRRAVARLEELRFAGTMETIDHGEVIREELLAPTQLLRCDRDPLDASSSELVIAPSPWLAQQLAAGFTCPVDLIALQRLRGSAQAMWLWLQAQHLALDEQRTVEVTPVLLRRWGIGRHDEQSRLNALRQAARTINAEPAALMRLAIEPQGTGWQLRAQRLPPDHAPPCGASP